MGIFRKKKEPEDDEREPVKQLDRSEYVRTAPVAKKTVKKSRKGEPMVTEKKETKTAAKKTAEKEPAKKTATKTAAAKKTESAVEKKTAAKTTAAKKETAKPAEEKAAAPKKAAKDTKTWHITKNAEMDKWQVKATENERVTKYFKTKAEAEEYVKTLLANNEGSKVVTHKKDGKFQKK